MTISLMVDSWVALAIAILTSVFGTIAMKLSQGLRKAGPAVCLAIFYILSFVALTFAMQSIDLSVVYAIWSGVGTVLVYAIGVIYFKESISLKKAFYISLIVIGVTGIHLGDFSIL